MNQQIEIQFVEINTNRRMLELLELRLKFIRHDWVNKTEYEKNEIEIKEIKTFAEIERMKVIVAEKEQMLLESFSEYVNEQELVCHQI